MKIGRCSICHHHLDLQALAQDESTRDLLSLVAKTPHTVMVPLLAYLGLFRPKKRDLANDRALHLAEEALQLTTDHEQKQVEKADDDAAWRRQMRRLGYDPDRAMKGQVRRLNED